MIVIIKINGYKFNKPVQEDFDWLEENYTMRLSDIENHLGYTDETIYRMLKALGIERERLYDRSLPNTKEVIEELMNPYLSHVKIAEKYNVHETTVGHRRKSLGVNVRRNMGSTRLEDKISLILDALDYAYIDQKKIDVWSIDFYMGQKICIDVHGTWAHSHNPERDVRKENWLVENGYRYLAINEEDIDEAEETIKKFMSGFPLTVKY